MKVRFLGSVILVVLGNNLSILGGLGGVGQPADFLIKVALWTGVGAWIVFVERMRWEDVGFRRANLGSDVALGLAAGALMALPGLLFLAFPLVVDEPIRAAGADPGRAAPVHVALLAIMLVNLGAIFEEVLFRGLIQERAVAWWGATRGIAFSVAAFVIWHVVVVYHGIQETNVTASAVPFALLYAASAVPLAVAGVVFSVLRHRTGNLAAPWAAHWLVNTLLQGSVIISTLRAPA